ncbi:MAG: YihY/virulence factor BrkB family protein [Chthoniobacteraceae bacterium]|nr:YihY/virulence factor BrkB family protein [Chthoniobacteraceae bacterium]
MSLESLWAAAEASVRRWYDAAEMHICRGGRCIWKILVRTLAKYVETDGELRAASFGYYAFFALFPLILLFVTLGTMIWGDKNLAATQVLGFIKPYFPVGPNEQSIVEQTVSGVIASRGQAGIVAVLALAWSSLRFFQALVHGVNRAWGMQEYSWWHLPLANLGMVAILGSTLLLGIVAPVVMRGIEAYWHSHSVVGLELLETSFRITRLILPWLILFYGLVMFYKYAPRRKIHLKEVWVGALTVTLFVQLLNKAFVFYAANFAKFNALYGTLGSVVAVLMWIYLAGSLIIFGGCLCAAQSEVIAEEQEALAAEI